MAKKKSKVAEPTQTEKNVGEILSKTDQFVEKNLKQIITVVAVIILLVVAGIGVHRLYLLPKEQEAQESIFPGENYFSEQKWDLALNGDSLDYTGFLGIIDDYGFTKTANLAKAYAGICYYHLGDTESALSYLKKYSGKDKLLASSVNSLIGDCYADQDQPEDAIKYFKKAAKVDNKDLSPIYLKKAATVYESTGDYKAALEIYNTIRTKYSESTEAANIEKYIERAKILINK
jgi:tetratricopeptide (TPR) repeat protein